MAKQRMGDGTAGRISGEYGDLLLSAIKEIRDDQKEFRQHVGGKLEFQSKQNQEIMVTLAEGTGRMNLMQASIDGLKASVAETDRRIRNIETGSGVRRSVSSSFNPEESEEKKGGWISADKLPMLITTIITGIASIAALIVSLSRPNATPTIAANTTSNPPAATAKQSDDGK